MIALIGLNANAAMYIVGTSPMGNGWNPNDGIAMTDNLDGTYTYDVTIDGDVWFCFAEALTPGNSNEDWSVFNGQYRYGPTGGVDQTVTATEWTTTQKQGNGNGSYKFHGSGDKYTVTFDETNHKFKIDGYVEPIVYESFTVAGNNADIFGETWNVTLTQNDMTLDETDGLYKLVKQNVEIEASTLYYKVAANHSWGESWGNPSGPEGNQDYVFTENGTYDLTFKFNFETKEVSLDAVKVQDGPAIDPYTGKLYIVGQVNDNGWNPSTGIAMLTEDEDTFTLANAQIIDSGDGFGYFSFMAVLGSNSDSWPANGYRIGAAEDGTVAVLDQFVDMGGFGTVGAFKVEPGYYNITVVLSAGDHGQLKLTAGQAPEPTVDDVYIIGDVNEIGWNATDGVKMTYNEGIYTATITTQNQGDLGVAYFGFTKKLADPESESENIWDDIASFRFGPVSDGPFVMTEELLGQECDLATDGSFESIAIPEGTWTVTVDLVHNKFTINGTWPGTPEPTVDDVYIIGDVNEIGWNATDGVKMTYNEGIYTATITTQNQGDLGVAYFGFTKKLADPESESENIWDDIASFRFGPVSDGPFVMTEELLGQECDLATDGSFESIAMPEGTWTVTIDLVNHKFTITGEWPDTPGPQPSVRGDVNKDGNVRIDDVTALIDYLLSGNGDDLDLVAADCNKDGDIRIDDVTSLIDFLLGGSWPVEEMVYTVVGPEAVFGSNWNTNDNANNMTPGANGEYTWSKSGVSLYGNFEFKVVGNHDYAIYEWPIGMNNWVANVAEEGVYDIVITFKPDAPDAERITCDLTKTGDVAPVEHVYTVAGAPSSLFGTEWDPANESNNMVKGADGKYTWKYEGYVASGATEVAFKVVQDHAWTYAWPSSNYETLIGTEGAPLSVYIVTITFDPNAADADKVQFYLQEVQNP